jgi:serine/threonine-protein kinase
VGDSELLVGRYRLHEPIGEGGMGVVYRAEQIALGRTVAIKMLHARHVGSPALVNRFHVEARAASRLRHRGSVALYDFGVAADGSPFLVMEFVLGPTLCQFIRECWPVPLALVVDLSLQIVSALGDAHEAGVIHGDIKTDNILVEARRNGQVRSKIVDYGLARLVGEAADGSYGTPGYTAPEVAAGEAATVSSDLYSVGVTLYEMLTGAPPFGAGTAIEILSRQHAEVILPPSRRQPSRDIAPALEHVAMKALARTPGSRFTSAEDFAAALERVRPPDEPNTRRCPCGAVIGVRMLICPHCGASRPGLIPPAPPDLPTQGLTPETGKTRLSPGPEPPVEERLRELRVKIGGAIARGAADEIATGYLDLALMVSSFIGAGAAARELEEAIDVVTAGGGPRARRAPGSLWKLLLELARLYDVEGDRGRARTIAADAHFQAVASRSRDGEVLAAAEVERLRREQRPDRRR